MNSSALGFLASNFS